MNLPNIRFPWATLALCTLVLASYLYFGAEPYASTQAIATFGLASWNPVGVVTSLFMHQGVRHLLANLIPLAAFALLLESTTLSGGAVIVIFLASGIAGGLVYVVLNPGALIIGASAAIAGLMSAAVALKRSGEASDARRLLITSLVYLPVLLTVMALDKQ